MHMARGIVGENLSSVTVFSPEVRLKSACDVPEGCAVRPRITSSNFVSALRFAGLTACATMMMPAAPLSAQNQAPQIAPPNRTELVPPSLRREERPTTLTIDGGFERAPCALDRAEYADIKVTLTGVEFIGLDRVPGLSLDDAYQGYLGRDLPLSVLCDIRAQANNILRAEGYLATVEIPEQNLGDGVADFRVVFGRLKALRVRGDAGPSESTVARYLRKLTMQDVFNTRDAERYLLLADDLPGLDVRMSLRPAANGEPGDLVGEIAVLRQKASAFVNVQNLGSSAVGRFGATLQGEVYDITGLGDRTFVTAFTTLEFSEQHTVQIGHDFAVGGEGLRLGGTFTYSTTDPDNNLPGLDIESESVLGNVFASYPLQRSRTRSAFLNVGFDIVDQNVEVSGIDLTEDKVRTIYARLSGQMTDQASVRRIGGYTPYEPRFNLRYGAEFRQGLDVFSASPDCRPNLLSCLAGGAVPPSRIEADPTPFLIRFDLGAEFRPTPLWTLAVNSNAQVSTSPLPAFEEFSAGSFSIGRGYDPGAVLGDSGVSGAFELRYGSLVPTQIDGVALQPYAFTDIAYAWNEDPSRRALNPDRLWSAGGGLRAAWGSNMQGDFMIAVPLERPDLAATRGDVRFMFSLTARLFPWRF